MEELTHNDLKVMNEILKSGKDVVVRHSPNGISILSQKMELRKRKDKQKTE